MKKSLMFGLVALALVLSGCLSEEAQPTSRPGPTTVLTLPAGLGDSGSSLGPDSGCTVVARRPTPGPTQESIFPPVGSEDWVRGPDTARVTIIEYSDFQ